MSIGIVHFLRAEVAELVDALGSGSSGCTPVRVQIPASAPFLKNEVQSQRVAPFYVFGKMQTGLSNSSSFVSLY